MYFKFTDQTYWLLVPKSEDLLVCEYTDRSMMEDEKKIDETQQKL